uniref:MCM_N domain-containing protein n=1 Tax=Ascaris lumbricoides TaxID=6252 RepID=A0A0M3IS31_ASCLU
MANEIRDFDKEKEKIRDFLSTFYYEDDSGGKNFPYADQIIHLAERDQVGLYINLDDVHEFDPGLVDAIRGNARRYHQLFSDVVDELIHDHLGDQQPPVRDALDAFIFQRIYMDRTQKEAGGQMVRMGNVRNKYPPELMRRL